MRVGGDLAGRMGQTIDVPITVDLSGAPGRQLGSYRSQLTWNPALLELVQVKAGNFAAPSPTPAPRAPGRNRSRRCSRPVRAAW